MSRKLVLLLYSAVLIICISFSYYYISSEGNFTITSYPTASEKVISKENVLYYGYDIEWKGIGSPRLEEIKFIRRDGTNVEGNNNKMNIQPYIAPNSKIGLLDKETVISEGSNENFITIKGYKVSKDFYLVLRVKVSETLVNNDVNTIRITYSKFGRTKSLDIPLEEGLVSDSYTL